MTHWVNLPDPYVLKGTAWFLTSPFRPSCALTSNLKVLGSLRCEKSGVLSWKVMTSTETIKGIFDDYTAVCCPLEVGVECVRGPAGLGGAQRTEVQVTLTVVGAE